MALKKVLKLQSENILVTGPKMIGCFGDSYLFLVFVRIGIFYVIFLTGQTLVGDCFFYNIAYSAELFNRDKKFGSMVVLLKMLLGRYKDEFSSIFEKSR